MLLQLHLHHELLQLHRHHYRSRFAVADRQLKSSSHESRRPFTLIQHVRRFQCIVIVNVTVAVAAAAVVVVVVIINYIHIIVNAPHYISFGGLRFRQALHFYILIEILSNYVDSRRLDYYYFFIFVSFFFIIIFFNFFN